METRYCSKRYDVTSLITLVDDNIILDEAINDLDNVIFRYATDRIEKEEGGIVFSTELWTLREILKAFRSVKPLSDKK